MGGCSSKSYPSLAQVDLGGECTPTSPEEGAHAEFNQILQDAPGRMAIIEDYPAQGCQNLVQQAMAANATPELERQCFEALEASVQGICGLWYFSKALEERLESMLLAMCTLAGKAPDGAIQLDAIPGLTNHLAYILQFALVFDHTRMQRCVLQNDFSFFRRMLPKFGGSIGEDEVNGMSNFVAEHIPMIRSLAKGANAAYQKNDATAPVLATLANTTYNMLKSKVSPDMKNYVATVMTGAALIFDHVDPVGVFAKSSPVNIKGIILILQKEFPTQPQLLGALHFSTKTFRNAPDAIQELFE